MRETQPHGTATLTPTSWASHSASLKCMNTNNQNSSESQVLWLPPRTWGPETAKETCLIVSAFTLPACDHHPRPGPPLMAQLLGTRRQRATIPVRTRPAPPDPQENPAFRQSWQFTGRHCGTTASTLQCAGAKAEPKPAMGQGRSRPSPQTPL